MNEQTREFWRILFDFRHKKGGDVAQQDFFIQDEIFWHHVRNYKELQEIGNIKNLRIQRIRQVIVSEEMIKGDSDE